MTGNKDNRLAVSKEYMDHMERLMNRWYDIRHDLYMKVCPLLITLSVAAIGFAASYILDGRYHSERYENTLGYIVLFCLFAGGFLLIVSCGCGLRHLLNSLQFVQCIAEFFSELYKVAAKKYYRDPADKRTIEENNTSEWKEPPSWPWYWQIWSFFGGIILLIFWVALDFFLSGNPLIKLAA